MCLSWSIGEEKIRGGEDRRKCGDFTIGHKSEKASCKREESRKRKMPYVIIASGFMN